MLEENQRVLSSFQNVVLEKHWPLAWSVAPVLAHKSLEPPQFVCNALRINAPTFPKILLHLKVLLENHFDFLKA